MADDCPVKKYPRIDGDAGPDNNTNKWEVEAILSDELTRSVELEHVVVCEVTEKKAISRLVKDITSKFPAERLKHVKRVRSCAGNGGDGSQYSIWICPLETAGIPLEDFDGFDCLEFLRSHGLDPAGLGMAQVCQVSKLPPLTRAQYEEGAKHWPVTFHESQEVKKKVSTAEFSKSELNIFAKHMTAALDVAELGKTLRGMPVGAVVVDPMSQKVIASAYDLRHQNPLHHTAMVIIDLVAKSQGGGVWNMADNGLNYVNVSSEVVSEGAKSGPYLCSGYDLYITREPCIMCSMALVHARINRVFYGCPSEDGALGSKLKLHTLKGLNHHFDVYRGLMKRDCQGLFSTQQGQQMS